MKSNKLRGTMSVIIAASAGAIAAAPANAWTKAYVVEWIEAAHHYAPYDEDAFSPEAPGADCPAGVSRAPDYRTLLIAAGHPADEVDYFLDPQRRSEPGFRRTLYGLRGVNGEDVYREPWTAIEQPYPQVEGELAYGFDLDHDPTTGYTGVDGTPGVDNGLYTVTGCVGFWRGPSKTSAQSMYAMESMANGAYTVLIILEGSQDPHNDANATLSFRASPDNLIRDANGEIAWDYSFRIGSQPEYESTINVRITDGVVETASPQLLVLRNSERHGPLELHEGQLRFRMTQSGALEGMVGGYREWERHWAPRANSVVETVQQLDMASFWYALRREADGMPDPETGQNMGISSVYNVWAVPAFAIPGEPETQAAVLQSAGE